MKIEKDLHTHTVWSHGSGTVEDNVRAAIERGLSAIAITDHDTTHIAYGIKHKRRYFEAIDACRQKYSGKIEVLTGVEANLVSLYGISDPERFDGYDIVVLGYHKAVKYRGFKSAWHFYPGIMTRALRQREKCVELNTLAYLRALGSARISFIAHPNYGVTADWARIGAKCAETGTAIEINNRNLGLSPRETDALKALGVKFVVSSDAHDPVDVGSFTSALEYISRTTLTQNDVINAKKEDF